MSTRGFVGLVVDAEEKISYNHSDSYPDGLGMDVLAWITKIVETGQLETTRDQARMLRLVEENASPSPEDMVRYSALADYTVGGNETSWYQLLRAAQGDLGAFLEAGVMPDNGRFPFDSLMAEFGYIVDLDAETFEAYVGFRKDPPTEGRWATPERAEYFNPVGTIGAKYYPVQRAAIWPLAELPTVDEFAAALEDEDEHDD